jgi:hypothetical protein
MLYYDKSALIAHCEINYSWWFSCGLGAEVQNSIMNREHLHHTLHLRLVVSQTHSLIDAN